MAEDESKTVELDDEDMDGVAGGWADGQWHTCIDSNNERNYVCVTNGKCNYNKCKTGVACQYWAG